MNELNISGLINLFDIQKNLSNWLFGQIFTLYLVYLVGAKFFDL